MTAGVILRRDMPAKPRSYREPWKLGSDNEERAQERHAKPQCSIERAREIQRRLMSVTLAPRASMKWRFLSLLRRMRGSPFCEIRWFLPFTLHPTLRPLYSKMDRSITLTGIAPSARETRLAVALPVRHGMKTADKMGGSSTSETAKDPSVIQRGGTRVTV